MNLRFLYSLCLIMIIGACHKGSVINPTPSDLLTKGQMIPLLVDIHITEASLKLNQTTILPKDIKLYYSSSYAPVFKKHKISPGQFDHSLQWYTWHINQLDEIYTEVITRLSKLETQVKAKDKLANPKAKNVISPVSPSMQKIRAKGSDLKKINQRKTLPAKTKKTESPAVKGN